jgi:phenylpyruvate tautomerase PptA (4-oxalocrotonate tautomerase family)
MDASSISCRAGETAAAESSARMSRRRVLTGASAAVAAVAAEPGLADAPSATDFGAPLAELHFPAGVLTLEQKSAMIKGVSEVLARATNVSAERAGILWVQIFETAEGGWGAAGNVVGPRK